MGKNKGMIIELTSLLDVILIMLFWVMMVSSDKADKAEQKAEEKVKAADVRAEQMIKDARDEADSKIDEAKKEVADKLALYQADNDRMKEFVQTVEGFENGEMLSISITYSDSKGTLSFARMGEQISSVVLNEHADVEYEIKRVLDQLPDKDGIILACFVYDGSTALHRDVESVKRALEGLRREYKNIYFAYVNASGRS